MLKGAHLPNGPLTDPDVAIFATGKFNAAFLLDNHTADDVARLRATFPIGLQPFFCARTVPSEWTHSDGSRYIPFYRDYTQAIVDQIARMYPAGVRDYQIDNEPNILGSWGPDGYWNWNAFMRDVFVALSEAKLHSAIPRDVRFGMTPFSHPQLDRWITASQGLAARCDWIAVHSYWQAEGDRWNPALGGNVGRFHNWQPDKPILVTEWGTSICQASDAPPLAEIEARMIREYPAWLHWVSTQPNVRGAFVFLIGGTDDWRGFRVTEAVAETLAGVW